MGHLERSQELKAPKTVVPEVVPFSTDETDKIIKACDAYTPKHNALRLKALVRLLLNSGLRIGDAVNLERAKIADGRLTLRTQKKNVHVSLPLPPDVLAALDALPATSRFFFTTGETQPKVVVGNYQNYLRKLFKLAAPTGLTPTNSGTPSPPACCPNGFLWKMCRKSSATVRPGSRFSTIPHGLRSGRSYWTRP
jgi:integrase